MIAANLIQINDAGGDADEGARIGVASAVSHRFTEIKSGVSVSRTRQMRRVFFRALFQQFAVVWPIVSGVFLAMIGPGLLIGYIEGWRISDALYFTFVTGLTIGYGDLTPRHIVSRCLAVMIGFSGIVLTGLVAAVSVRALERDGPRFGE